MQLCLDLYSELEGLALWKAPGLLFFPGTVIRRLSQESGQPLSYFSRALFLLFHVQRQHDLLWPPQLLTTGTQRRVQGVGGRSWHNHAVHQTQMSPYLKCFTWKPCDLTGKATLRDAVSNVLRRAEGVFWLSTCTHKCAYKCASDKRGRHKDTH